MQTKSAAENFVADSKPISQGTTNAPRFSAGLVTGLVTVVFLIVFGLVMMHGVDGINQHDHVVSTQAE